MLRRHIVTNLRDYAEANYDVLPLSILSQYLVWYFEDHQTQIDDFTIEKFTSEVMYAMEILRYGNYDDIDIVRIRLLHAIPDLKGSIPDIFDLMQGTEIKLTQYLLSIVTHVTRSQNPAYLNAVIAMLGSANSQFTRAVAKFVTLVWQNRFAEKMATYESEKIKVGGLGEVNFAVIEIGDEIFVNLQSIYVSDDPRDFQIQLVFDTRMPNAMPTIIHSEITLETALWILERNVIPIWLEYLNNRYMLSIKYWSEDED